MQIYKLILAMTAFSFVSQIGAMEVSQIGSAGKKPGLLNSKLTGQQQREFRSAIMGMRDILIKIHNGQDISLAEQAKLKEQEAVVNRYVELYFDDSFVAEKMDNHWKFIKKLERLAASKQLAESKVLPMECCICMEEKATVLIPCENKHDERICQSCLDDIMKKNAVCPICRGQLK